jgi:ribokinase
MSDCLHSAETLLKIRKMNVVGLGQCALDHTFIIDSFPHPDTKKEVIDWQISGGGPVATALVSLARLGVRCSFYGITGDDETGDKIRRSLETEGVDASGLITRPDSFSQTAFIAVEQLTGKRTIFWKRPSAPPLKPDELPDTFLDNADFLLVDGLMAEVTACAVKKAGAKSIPVMIDAGRVREGTVELARRCDYVVCSEEFAREFAANPNGFDPERALVTMKAFCAKATTITLGEKGSVTISDDTLFRTPAFSVKVVDTTGAGDVFHGGYIYGLLQGWGLKEVVRFASALAALKCRKPGGRAGIPGLDEVQAFLAMHDR